MTLSTVGLILQFICISGFNDHLGYFADGRIASGRLLSEADTLSLRGGEGRFLALRTVNQLS